jgi:hypothetical protein
MKGVAAAEFTVWWGKWCVAGEYSVNAAAGVDAWVSGYGYSLLEMRINPYRRGLITKVWIFAISGLLNA